MRIKMGVWEPGKADASRYDRASNLDEFVAKLRALNPGDEITLFFIQDGANQHDIELLPVKRPEPRPVEVLTQVSYDMDMEQAPVIKLGPLTAPATADFVSCMEMVVPSNTPSMWEDLYNKVTDILAVEGWLTTEQQAIVDAEVLKVIAAHNRKSEGETDLDQLVLASDLS